MINPKTEAIKKNPTAQLTQTLLNFRGSEGRKEFNLVPRETMD
jgi:hypothetical protein